MTFPKQPRTIDPARQAIAPYNFVPLPDQVITIGDADEPLKTLPSQDQYHANRHTGYLDCVLTTSSPLYTRAMMPLSLWEKRKQGKDKNEQELPPQPESFFFIEDANTPVIPGATLRGMMGTLIEIVSYSKVHSISDSHLVYRAVGDTTKHGERYRDRLMKYDGQLDRAHHYTPLIRGGYMHYESAQGRWYIVPAEVVDGTTYAYLWREGLEQTLKQIPQARVLNTRNAYKVHIRTGAYEYHNVKGGFLKIKYAKVLNNDVTRPGAGLREATLAMSGWMQGKTFEAVVYKEAETQSRYYLTDDQVLMYREQMSKEQKTLLGESGVLVDGHPIFFLLERDQQGQESVHFFGHPRMMRVPYPLTPLDYVPASIRNSGEATAIDMAEALFGYTKASDRQGKSRAYAGRLSFSDARLAEGQQDIWLTPKRTLVPKILASPKPTTFQHYLVQTEPNKFQIGRDRQGKPRYEVRLRDYAAPTPAETVLRGHKFYWHKGRVTVEDIGLEGSAKDTQTTKIQPVRPDVQFEFRLHFENLSSEELGAVLWVLQIAGDERYRLKVGMGKPFGMGAVKITSTLHLTDRQTRYTQFVDDKGWASGTTSAENLWSTALGAFQQFVLHGLGEKVAKRIEDVERIQSLLALLHWRERSDAWLELTRYMEIERPDRYARRGKRNEYRDPEPRPVLPHPLDVDKEFAREIGNQLLAVTETGQSSPQAPSSLPPGYYRGTVVAFNLGPNKSYGYIRRDGHPENDRLFVHRSKLAPGVTAIEEGKPVIFKVSRRPDKKEEAQDVKPASEE